MAILDEIRSTRSRSRSELVARTGLARGVVAQRVGELIELGLVVESDPGPSTGGRPPRRMSFRADAGHLLVADLGATSIDVAVTDLDGRILGHRDEPADIAAGPEQCLTRVDELFGELTAATRDLPGRLWGIGIGVPGPVEFRSGRPISPPIMPGWDGYPIRERLRRPIRRPGLGRQRRQHPRPRRMAVRHRGRPRQRDRRQDRHRHRRRDHLQRPNPPRARRARPGDVGHVQVIDDASVVCRCGNVGCLEALAGGAALARDGEAAALAGRSERLRTALDQHGRVTAEDVARAASFGDPVAVGLLLGAGHRVGLCSPAWSASSTLR